MEVVHSPILDQLHDFVYVEALGIDETTHIIEALANLGVQRDSIGVQSLPQFDQVDQLLVLLQSIVVVHDEERTCIGPSHYPHCLNHVTFPRLRQINTLI